jgi:hypothetical protein
MEKYCIHLFPLRACSFRLKVSALIPVTRFHHQIYHAKELKHFCLQRMNIKNTDDCKNMFLTRGSSIRVHHSTFVHVYVTQLEEAAIKVFTGMMQIHFDLCSLKRKETS